MADEIISRTVFYSGRVQGVGFRYTAASIAKHHQVNGWVRNLDDGRVELRVEGLTSEVEAYLKSVRDYWGKNIRDEQVLKEEAEGLERVEVRH